MFPTWTKGEIIQGFQDSEMFNRNVLKSKAGFFLDCHVSHNFSCLGFVSDDVRHVNNARKRGG